MPVRDKLIVDDVPSHENLELKYDILIRAFDGNTALLSRFVTNILFETTQMVFPFMSDHVSLERNGDLFFINYDGDLLFDLAKIQKIRAQGFGVSVKGGKLRKLTIPIGYLEQYMMQSFKEIVGVIESISRVAKCVRCKLEIVDGTDTVRINFSDYVDVQTIAHKLKTLGYDVKVVKPVNPASESNKCAITLVPFRMMQTPAIRYSVSEDTANVFDDSALDGVCTE